MYYGFAQHQAPGVSNALALRMALAEIRTKLDLDSIRLSRRLLAAQRAAALAAPSASSGPLLPHPIGSH